MFIPIYNLAGFTNNKDIPKIAKVINNSDPKGLGRIKVSLKGMFDPTDDTGTNLPWIRRMSSGMGIGTEEMNIPPVGSNVELIWPYDNRHAFYRGIPFGDSSLIGSFNGYDWGWATASGFSLMVQKSTGKFIIKTNTATISGDSNNINISADNINQTGSTKITISGGSVEIGSNTKIDGVTFLSHTHTNGNMGNPTGGVIQ